MFLGLPGPLVRGTDPDPDPDPSLSHKGVERTKILLSKKKFKTKFIFKAVD
jgi:hypothetical protein